MIEVTVLTPPPPLVRVPVSLAVGLLTGVELGLESSKHDEEPDAPTVNSAEEPPIPYRPLLNAARMNCVPAAMLVFHVMEVADPTDSNWNGWPWGITPRIVTGATAVSSQ